jgi:hypothetical protein
MGRPSRAVRPNSVALRLSSEPSTRVCRQLAYLHGMGNWRPTRRRGEARASGCRHICVDRVVVGDGDYSCERAGCRRRGRDLSCEVETPRARRKLLVRDGDLSCEAETPHAGWRLVGEGTP